MLISVAIKYFLKVQSCTYRLICTKYLVSNVLVTEVKVEEPIISDHSIITAKVDLHAVRQKSAGWRYSSMSLAMFDLDLQQSVVLCSPPVWSHATTTH